MKLTNKIELKVENYEKCFVIVDADCPLGQLYDYSCALQSFIVERMKEAQEAQEAQKQKDQKESQAA